MIGQKFIALATFRVAVADAVQLVCLSNLENFNALFVKDGLPQGERLSHLNAIAIHQMTLLTAGTGIKRLNTQRNDCPTLPESISINRIVSGVSTGVSNCQQKNSSVITQYCNCNTPSSLSARNLFQLVLERPEVIAMK